MIANFTKDVAKILEALDIDPHSINHDKAFELATICFTVFDRGMAWERERVIPIIQRLAIDPMTIVREIRRPIR